MSRNHQKAKRKPRLEFFELDSAHPYCTLSSLELSLHALVTLWGKDTSPWVQFGSSRIAVQLNSGDQNMLYSKMCCPVQC